MVLLSRDNEREGELEDEELTQGPFSKGKWVELVLKEHGGLRLKGRGYDVSEEEGKREGRGVTHHGSVVNESN